MEEIIDFPQIRPSLLVHFHFITPMLNLFFLDLMMSASKELLSINIVKRAEILFGSSRYIKSKQEFRYFLGNSPHIFLKLHSESTLSYNSAFLEFIHRIKG